MLIEKTKFKDKKWLKSMKHRDCLVYGGEGAVGHHLFKDRNDDRHAVPLRGSTHTGFPDSLHSWDNELEWWVHFAPDIVKAAMKLWAREFYEENK